MTNLSGNTKKASSFGLKLLKENFKENENVLISPLSVLSALAITMNGAEGETLKEMEEIFSFEKEELNSFMKAYTASLQEGKEFKLSSANSIWFNNKGIKVKPKLLNTNKETYGADIFEADFNNETAEKINSWVNEKTDGMIPSIIDELKKYNMMVLLNALSFQGKWMETYKEDEVLDMPFTKENGQKLKASYLTGTEREYIEASLATGFVKPYKGNKYSFAALLPNKDVKLSQLIDSLLEEDIPQLLKNTECYPVKISLPKFNVSCDMKLKESLINMGTKLLFDDRKADLSSLGSCDTNLYVSDVIHKTHISLGEKGTKAGAASAVLVARALALFGPEEKEVRLNRPFLYMLFDNETGIPFFIGTMNEPKL